MAGYRIRLCECGAQYRTTNRRLYGCDDCRRLFPPGAARAEALHALYRGPATQAQIAADSGVDRRSVWAALQALVQGGMVTRAKADGDYVYRLGKARRA